MAANAKFLAVFCTTFVPLMAFPPELDDAVESFDIKRIEKLARKKVDGGIRDDKFGSTALHLMARIQRGTLNKVKPEDLPDTLKYAIDLLLWAGAKPDEVNKYGETAVHPVVHFNAYEVWNAFYDKMFEEIAKGESNGVWSKCMDVGSSVPTSDIMIDDTPLSLACDSYRQKPNCMDDEIAKDAKKKDMVYGMIRVQAARLGDNFAMNEIVAEQAMIAFMESFENVKYLLKKAGEAGARTFKEFFLSCFKEYKLIIALQTPKPDWPLAIALLKYREENVYAFYLTVRDYFVKYHREFVLEDKHAFVVKYDERLCRCRYADKDGDGNTKVVDYGRLRKLAKNIRNTEVAEFEKELFRHKGKILKDIGKFRIIDGKAAFPDEIAVIMSIIQYETGVPLEDVRKVVKNLPKGESTSSSHSILHKFLCFKND